MKAFTRIQANVCLAFVFGCVWQAPAWRAVWVWVSTYLP